MMHKSRCSICSWEFSSGWRFDFAIKTVLKFRGYKNIRNVAFHLKFLLINCALLTEGHFMSPKPGLVGCCRAGSGAPHCWGWTLAN